jgi:hypothetical protein
VLSTFIFEAKKKLKDIEDVNPKILTVLDELDLYRPTHKALTRLLELTRSLHQQKTDSNVVRIIEDTLYQCVMQWLGWKITYQTSPLLRRIGMKTAKWLLRAMRLIGFRLEIKTLHSLMKLLSLADRWLGYSKDEMSFKELKQLPAFLECYKEYGFQIHGEGHTHKPLEEELNIGREKNSTYINFGTWRDQIVGRKKQGYRRRGVLRAVYILDLKDTSDSALGKRSFDYSTHDIVHWSDKSDAFARIGRFQPRI